MEAHDKYMNQLYHFKGKWGVPGVCGLMVSEKKDKTLVIATNLYEKNPGTSISRWAAQLATAICNDLKIIHNNLIFIEHNPDRHSKLDFYKETFDVVEFRWDEDCFIESICYLMKMNTIDDMLL